MSTFYKVLFSLWLLHPYPNKKLRILKLCQNWQHTHVTNSSTDRCRNSVLLKYIYIRNLSHLVLKAVQQLENSFKFMSGIKMIECYVQLFDLLTYHLNSQYPDNLRSVHLIYYVILLQLQQRC